MKLHLPTRLRSAIVACFSIVSALTATLASGTVAGGLLCAAAAPYAYAAYDADSATFSGTDNANINPTAATYDGVELLTFNMGTSGTGNYLNQSSWTYAGNIQIGAAGATETGFCLNNGHRNQTDVFTGKVTGTGLLSKTGAGTNLVIAFEGDVTEYSGNIRLGSSAAFTLRFGSGSSAPAGQSVEHGVSGTGNITFSGSTNDTLVYNYSSSSPVYITNRISATGAASAQVQLNGGADYVLTKDASITQLTLADNTVLHIGAEGKSSATVLGGLTMGAGAAVHVDAGSLELTGAESLVGTFAIGAEGALHLSRATTLDGELTIADGGALVLGNMDAFDNNYRYSAGENGFLESHTLTVFRGGSISAGENAHVTIGEASGTLLQNGTVQVALSEEATSVYHVNAGEAVYGGTSGHIDTERVTEIALHGGNLSLQADLAEGQSLSLSAAGKVTLANDVTLASSSVTGGQHLTVDGSGTYAIGTLGELSEARHADTWQGWTHMTSRSDSAKGEISHKGNLLFQVEGISYNQGGAISAYNSLSLDGNGDIIFRENRTDSSYVYGGAIYNNSAFTLNNNGSVSFIGNHSYGQLYGGGAIANAQGSYASFSLSGNGDVLFSGNSSMADGGAIYNYWAQSFTISGNESVSFIGNIARIDGGAIYNSHSSFSIIGNGDVTFSGNRSQLLRRSAGAIYNDDTFTLSGNGNVVFRQNQAAKYYSGSLISIYSSGTLNLSASEGKSILFMDSIYASGTVNLNQDGTGDIIFTGISTEADLRELRGGSSVSADQILESRTSEMAANAMLYGGRLMVEDEAVLKVDGLSVAQGASVVVKDGTLALNNGNATITTASGAEKAVLTGASLGESSLAGADAEHRGTVNGAHIDLADGASFTMQHLVLGATTRITDDPATLVLDDVTAELEVGVNVTFTEEEQLAAGTEMVQVGGAEASLTLAADSSVVMMEASTFDSVTLTGSSLVLELSGMDVEIYNGTEWIGVSFTSGTDFASIDPSLAVTLSIDGVCYETGYTVVGEQAPTTIYFRGGKEICVTPEPATATLSLLALAALAARRKRK